MAKAGGLGQRTQLEAQILDSEEHKPLIKPDAASPAGDRGHDARDAFSTSDVGVMNLGGAYLEHDNLRDSTLASTASRVDEQGNASLSDSFDYNVDPTRSPLSKGPRTPSDTAPTTASGLEANPALPTFDEGAATASVAPGHTAPLRAAEVAAPSLAEPRSSQAAGVLFRDDAPAQSSGPSSEPVAQAPVGVSETPSSPGPEKEDPTASLEPRSVTPPANHGTPPVDPGSPPVDHGNPPVDPVTPPVDPGSPPIGPGTADPLAEVTAQLDVAVKELDQLRNEVTSHVADLEGQKEVAHQSVTDAAETVAQSEKAVEDKAAEAEAAQQSYQEAQAELDNASQTVDEAAQRAEALSIQADALEGEVAQAQAQYEGAVNAATQAGEAAAQDKAQAQALEDTLDAAADAAAAAQANLAEAQTAALALPGLHSEETNEKVVLDAATATLTTEAAELKVLEDAMAAKKGSGYYEHSKKGQAEAITDQAALDAQKKVVVDAQAAVDTATATLHDTQNHISTLSNALQSAETDAAAKTEVSQELQATLKPEHDRLEAELDQHLKDKAAAEDEADKAKTHWDNRDHELQETKAAQADAEEDLKSAQDDCDAATTKAHDAKEHWDNRDQELQALRDELGSNQDALAAAKAGEDQLQTAIDDAQAELAQKEAEVHDLEVQKEQIVHANNGYGNGDQTAPGGSADNNNAENSTSDTSTTTSGGQGGGSDANNGFGNGDQTAPGGSADNNNAENAALTTSSVDTSLDAAVDQASSGSSWVNDSPATGGAEAQADWTTLGGEPATDVPVVDGDANDPSASDDALHQHLT